MSTPDPGEMFAAWWHEMHGTEPPPASPPDPDPDPLATLQELFTNTKETDR